MKRAVGFCLGMSCYATSLFGQTFPGGSIDPVANDPLFADPVDAYYQVPIGGYFRVRGTAGDGYFGVPGSFTTIGDVTERELRYIQGGAPAALIVFDDRAGAGTIVTQGGTTLANSRVTDLNAP